MRVLKFVGAVLVTAAAASVLALSGLGAAYAAADDRPGDVEVVDVHDVYVHDLVNVGDVFAPVTVFAPIRITDVLNDVEILSD